MPRMAWQQPEQDKMTYLADPKPKKGPEPDIATGFTFTQTAVQGARYTGLQRGYRGTKQRPTGNS